jgi:hypothetical protein
VATKAEPKTFTAAQLRAWKAYEKVRLVGRFNMFDTRARRETGLSGDVYSFVMQNYVALKEAVESKSA